jgi:hypothetical protein
VPYTPLQIRFTLKQMKCEACQNEHTPTNIRTTISNNLARFIHVTLFAQTDFQDLARLLCMVI